MPGGQEKAARAVWRQADAVCLDVDSTVIRVEAIDHLAELCGVAEEVARLTRQAMGGGMTYQEALGKRLSLMQPSLHQVEEFGRLHTPADVLTPGIEKLVKALREKGVPVYLVSGGFRQLIEPIADHLKIPRGNIYANVLLFDKEGRYSSFDDSQPTSHTGGKAVVAAAIKSHHNKVVMIGDGVTDMEAVPPADVFIGFGGNVVREKVVQEAPWFVHSFQELLEELQSAGDNGSQ